eukprot:2376829-Rhodomonas_salina.1
MSVQRAGFVVLSLGTTAGFVVLMLGNGGTTGEYELRYLVRQKPVPNKALAVDFVVASTAQVTVLKADDPSCTPISYACFAMPSTDISELVSFSATLSHLRAANTAWVCPLPPPNLNPKP